MVDFNLLQINITKSTSFGATSSGAKNENIFIRIIKNYYRNWRVKKNCEKLNYEEMKIIEKFKRSEVVRLQNIKLGYHLADKGIIDTVSIFTDKYVLTEIARKYFY